jgi:hypothetical protein
VSLSRHSEDGAKKQRNAGADKRSDTHREPSTNNMCREGRHLKSCFRARGSHRAGATTGGLDRDRAKAGFPQPISSACNILSTAETSVLTAFSPALYRLRRAFAMSTAAVWQAAHPLAPGTFMSGNECVRDAHELITALTAHALPDGLPDALASYSSLSLCPPGTPTVLTRE